MMTKINFKRITSGQYQCIEYPNYSIKKLKNKLWVGYDKEMKTGNCICCSDTSLKNVKEVIMDYISNGRWYK